MSLLLVLALTALASPGAVVIKPVANMYSAPTEDADVVSQAICGVSVIVDEEKGEWVKVRTPDDYPGWMPTASLRRYSPVSTITPHPEASCRWRASSRTSTAKIP